jgi:TRAP-type uncharacterized transport system fused permease subunit
VSLAAYAAAGIAGSSPLRTGVSAMGIAIGGFLVPFAFVYDPLLLLSGPPLAVAATLLSAGVGATALAASVAGYMGAPVPLLGRMLLAGAGIALLAPGVFTDVAGMVLFAGAAWVWRRPPETAQNSL